MSEALSEAEEGGDSARGRFPSEVDVDDFVVDLRLVGLAEDNDEEAFWVVVCFALLLDLDGPAPEDARLGGLNGRRRRFFPDCCSVAIFVKQ